MKLLFTSAARKAQVAALIAFLGPILTYIAATGDWSWRAFIGAVVSGVIAGLTTYQVQNQWTPEQIQSLNRHEA